MQFTRENLKLCVAKEREDYHDWRDGLAGDDFRTISLSFARKPDGRYVYTAVMAIPDIGFDGRAYSLIESDDLVAKLIAHADEGLFPYILAATGSGSEIRYAACFRPLDAPTEVDFNLSRRQFDYKVSARRRSGQMPLWIDSFGTAQNPRYCAIWAANPEGVAWNAEATADMADDRQQRHEAIVSVGGRPVLQALTPDNGHARVYVDSQLQGGFHMLPAAGESRFKTELTEPDGRLFLPVRIASNLIDGKLSLAAIYARRDEVVARTYRQRGPGPAVRIALPANAAAIAKIDDYMENYVRSNRIRGAALAIVEDTRLVFTRGYTYAEPGYADIGPETRFRLASLSKTFCAAAAWKALLDSSYKRDTPMQDILHLSEPDGSAPKGRFGDITVRNLLEGSSGIDQGRFRNAMWTIREGRSEPQPVSMATLLAAVAEDYAGSPGTQAYGKTDYILLGEVARVLAGGPTFEAALRRLVLDPLQMTRTMGSRSRIEDRGSNEALHHGENLATDRSAVHTDRRLVAKGYGHENIDLFDGAGGLSAAIIDVARLCAMFSCRTGNPVFDPLWLDRLFRLAVDAYTRFGQAHGSYFGFGKAEATTTGAFKLAKGGDLNGWGAHARFDGETGGLFIAIAINADVRINIQGDLKRLARAVNWQGGDLFPDYNMSRLSP